MSSGTCNRPKEAKEGSGRKKEIYGIQDSKLASGVCVLRNINKRSCAKPITRISQLSAKATSGSYSTSPLRERGLRASRQIYKCVNRKRKKRKRESDQRVAGLGRFGYLEWNASTRRGEFVTENAGSHELSDGA